MSQIQKIEAMDVLKSYVEENFANPSIPLKNERMAYELGVLAEVGELLYNCASATLAHDATTVAGKHIVEIHFCLSPMQVPAFKLAVENLNKMQQDPQNIFSVKCDVFGGSLEEDEVFQSLITSRYDNKLLISIFSSLVQCFLDSKVWAKANHTLEWLDCKAQDVQKVMIQFAIRKNEMRRKICRNMEQRADGSILLRCKATKKNEEKARKNTEHAILELLVNN
ncbi:hypothetical protein HELRODRAFT_158386 [Helobdella robusta]|uniref:Uncharacterized protein n=1 Tax=Helobdella robusta TaxID=6412 RepID=T1EMR0_HELRO|nr:hypothetical protein HELRODRAFT_158386 [Helobdella robusta]ESO12000.1 hypothetical protein HELRODRAFT_158386 [Helobdella robusta]